MRIKVEKGFKYEGKQYEPGDVVDLPDNVAKSVLRKDHGRKVEDSEPEPLGDADETPDITDEVNQSEEKVDENEGLPEKLNNLLHRKYSDLWGDSYETPKRELLKKMFGKEHTNELTEEEASKLEDELDRRMNQRDVEEKAESEVSLNQSSGGLMLKQKQEETGEKGVSVDKAREMAKTMGSPQMVKDLIEGMDFEELEQYIWDPEEDRGLPYTDLEPKVDLYEMVLPLWEAYTGWSYNIGPFEFNKNEEDDVYECKVVITREGGPSDPTRIEFTKTKKKENLMRQKDINRGAEKEQWKEFMQSLAFKRAMRPQMRLWVDKFVNAYRKAKG